MRHLRRDAVLGVRQARRLGRRRAAGRRRARRIQPDPRAHRGGHAGPGRAAGSWAPARGRCCCRRRLPERGAPPGKRRIPGRRATTRRSGARWPGCTRAGARRSGWRSSTGSSGRSAGQPAGRLGTLGRLLRRAASPADAAVRGRFRSPSGRAGRAVEGIAARLPSLCGPDPVPALLHGDSQQNNFVSTAGRRGGDRRGPVLRAPRGRPRVRRRLLPGRHRSCSRAYAQLAPVDPGFAGRRELWRLPGYLGVVAVGGGADFGRAFLSRLAVAMAHYT